MNQAAKANKIELSIVICTYNRNEYLPTALEHLANMDAEFNAVEFIVIDNNSTDGTKDTCQQFIVNHPGKLFKYILETKQGLSYARNRGISESNGEIIAFIDDDAFVNKSFSQNLLASYSKHPEILSSGGKISPLYEETEPKWMSKYLLPLVAAINLGDEDKKFKNGKYPIGANMAFRKSVFEKFGLFDTDLGRRGDNLESGEEKDLFNRINKEYDTYYLGNVEVQHIIPPKRTSIEYIRRMGMGYGRSERIRASKSGKLGVFAKILEELFKICASIVLAIYFTFLIQPAKGSMLLKFRWWVMKGFMN